jgi:hypothetical protein
LEFNTAAFQILWYSLILCSIELIFLEVTDIVCYLQWYMFCKNCSIIWIWLDCSHVWNWKDRWGEISKWVSSVGSFLIRIYVFFDTNYELFKMHTIQIRITLYMWQLWALERDLWWTEESF